MSVTDQNTSKRQQLVKTAREHLHHNRNKEALQLVNQANPKLQNDPEVLFIRAIASERLRKLKDAVDCATKSFRAFEHVDTALVLARTYRQMGKTDESVKWCERAKALAPVRAEVISYIQGGALEEGGRFDEAEALLRPFVEKYQGSGEPMPDHLAVEWSKLLVQHKHYDDAVSIIDTTLEKEGSLPPGVVNMQLHLKAKACDRAKDFPAAWEAAERANGIGRVEYDPELHEQQVDQLIENWSRERMAKFPLSTCDSEIPVFVAGMPRSGTSLIDQIIDAHPKAAGVGELATIESFAKVLGAAYNPELEPPECFGSMNTNKWSRAAKDYVRDITKQAPEGAERIVNKSLGNNKLVGLIARLFPKTRIIHAIRDPRDVAISCFMGGFNNNLHAWTTRVEWVAKSWELSDKMMAHWKESLDIPILDVHYERLVADPENEFPRLIDFLGLEWDDRCFEFHKSKRTVRTLSYDQVNRPLYTSSSGRHANYASFIEGIEFPEYDPWAQR